MSRGLRKFAGLPIPARKERDEDLLLFRELQKRERDRLVSLLQPVSEDFESNGNFPLFRMSSTRKGSGYDLFVDSDKNDYNWLKTPPATPLFQSLEMDAIASQPAVQRELPIVQPLSRFAGNAVRTNENSERVKSPDPKQKAPPRSETPSLRTTFSAATETKATTKNKPTTFISNLKMNQSMIIDTPISRRANAAPTVTKPVLNTQRKEGPPSLLASNLAKSQETRSTMSRGLSPMVRSTIRAQAPGSPDEKTRNQRIGRSSSVARTERPSLITRTDRSSDRSSSVTRTDRSSSALRGRNQNQISLPAANVNAVQRHESSLKTVTRQLRSPSVTRGGKVETENMSNNVETCSHENVTNKARTELAGGNGTQFLGSRMVDKLMNARKSSTEQRETRSNFRGSVNESYGSGYGKNMMSKSLLDMTLKNMDVKREPSGAGDFRRSSTTSGRHTNARIRSPAISS